MKNVTELKKMFEILDSAEKKLPQTRETYESLENVAVTKMGLNELYDKIGTLKERIKKEASYKLPSFFD